MSAFDLLSEPNRRRILDLVLEHEQSVSDLVTQLDMSQPAVSKHLRILRDGGLVASRVDGPRRLYRVTPAPLEEIEAWLEPYRRFWRGRLDALEKHLDQT